MIYRKKTQSSDVSQLQARYYVTENSDTGELEVLDIRYVYHAIVEDGKTIGKLVWQAISSCFGAGYWINEYAWKNNDGWKNNR